MRQALSDTGMLKLFEQVEMPLLFTLDDMEKAGIRARAEERGFTRVRLGNI